MVGKLVKVRKYPDAEKYKNLTLKSGITPPAVSLTEDLSGRIVFLLK
jgi:hypothetical protein